MFINTAMGWPAVPTEDLYAGGPTYPLSSLGIRLRGQPGEGFTVLGGVFQDNPPGGPFFNDSQLLGSTRWGGNFNLRTGALFIAEVQYALNPPPSGDAANTGPPPGLPGTYKLGVWYDTASFPSRQFDNAGVPLASPASNGIPRMLPNNFSIYALADQMVWRPDPKGAQALGVFARLMGAPGDRNLLSFSVNGGVVLKAPLPTRDNDSVGLGFGLVKLSSSATGFDHDVVFFTGMPYPIQSSETFIELTYQIQVAPWLVLQPDFQYVFNPGGGIPNPNAPTLRVGNEAVFGIRSTVTF
jgi:porin